MPGNSRHPKSMELEDYEKIFGFIFNTGDNSENRSDTSPA